MELYRSKIRELLEFNNLREHFYKEKEEAIQEVEERLNAKLPDSYRWFLKEYGGGRNGVYVNGCNGILYYHNTFKSFNIPKGYIIIEHCDEYSYCLDTEKMMNNECPVVNWSAHEKGIYPEADNFYEHLLEGIENAIENEWWEE